MTRSIAVRRASLRAPPGHATTSRRISTARLPSSRIALLAALSAFGLARPDGGADTAALARSGWTIRPLAYVMDLRHSTATAADPPDRGFQVVTYFMVTSQAEDSPVATTRIFPTHAEVVNGL